MATQSLNTPYIVVSGMALVAVISLFTFFQPMMSDIRATRDRIVQREEELNQKEDFLRSLDRKRQELDSQKIHEDRLNVILPTTAAYDDMVRVISLAATNAGATVMKIDNRSDGIEANINAERARGEELSIPEDVTVLAASVATRGTYQQFRTFLNNLEKSPRLSDVQKIDIRGNADQPDQVNAELLIQFYFRSYKP